MKLIILFHFLFSRGTFDVLADDVGKELVHLTIKRSINSLHQPLYNFFIVDSNKNITTNGNNGNSINNSYNITNNEYNNNSNNDVSLAVGRTSGVLYVAGGTILQHKACSNNNNTNNNNINKNKNSDDNNNNAISLDIAVSTSLSFYLITIVKVNIVIVDDRCPNNNNNNKNNNNGDDIDYSGYELMFLIDSYSLSIPYNASKGFQVVNIRAYLTSSSLSLSAFLPSSSSSSFSSFPKIEYSLIDNANNMLAVGRWSGVVVVDGLIPSNNKNGDSSIFSKISARLINENGETLYNNYKITQLNVTIDYEPKDPKFDRDNYNFNLKDDLEVGGLVGRVGVVEGMGVTYFLENLSENFVVGKTTGDIILIKKIILTRFKRSVEVDAGWAVDQHKGTKHDSVVLFKNDAILGTDAILEINNTLVFSLSVGARVGLRFKKESHTKVTIFTSISCDVVNCYGFTSTTNNVDLTTVSPKIDESKSGALSGAGLILLIVFMVLCGVVLIAAISIGVWCCLKRKTKTKKRQNNNDGPTISPPIFHQSTLPPKNTTPSISSVETLQKTSSKAHHIRQNLPSQTRSESSGRGSLALEREVDSEISMINRGQSRGTPASFKGEIFPDSGIPEEDETHNSQHIPYESIHESANFQQTINSELFHYQPVTRPESTFSKFLARLTGQRQLSNLSLHYIRQPSHKSTEPPLPTISPNNLRNKLKSDSFNDDSSAFKRVPTKIVPQAARNLPINHNSFAPPPFITDAPPPSIFLSNHPAITLLQQQYHQQGLKNYFDEQHDQNDNDIDADKIFSANDLDDTEYYNVLYKYNPQNISNNTDKDTNSKKKYNSNKDYNDKNNIKNNSENNNNNNVNNNLSSIDSLSSGEPMRRLRNPNRKNNIKNSNKKNNNSKDMYSINKAGIDKATKRKEKISGNNDNSNYKDSER